MKLRDQLRLWCSPRLLLRQILMLDDTAHSIALGTAVGMFIGLTPTVGIQMAMVLVFALLVSPLFRFNKVAAILTVYISNPLTMIPLYWFYYRVGGLFIEGNVDRAAFNRVHDWNTVLDLILEVGWPLIVGSLIVATVGTVVTYPLILWLLHSLRPPKRPPREAESKSLVGTDH
jgi:uncharacterized protein (DUF2062 family)